MPRETVLAGFAAPPPNAYAAFYVNGTGLVASANTNYFQLRNFGSGHVVINRIMFSFADGGPGTVQWFTGTTAATTSGGVLWLDTTRAGAPKNVRAEILSGNPIRPGSSAFYVNIGLGELVFEPLISLGPLTAFVLTPVHKGGWSIRVWMFTPE